MAVSQISPIVLAAGQSNRFGSDKLRHALSVKDQRKALILHSLSPWLEVFAEVSVVVREDNAALLHLLTDCDFAARLRLIPATRAHEGMSQSLVAGIQAASDADGWLIGMADMPFLQSQVIADSLSALQSGCAITTPEFEGRRGHPVGFDSRFLPALLALKGDIGARDILRSSKDLICSISATDDGIFRDIDILDDLKQSG